MKKAAQFFMAVILVFGISLSIAPKTRAQSFDVQKAIEAGDHKGLAEYYRSQAETQRNVAAMHDKMKTEYRKSHVHYKGIDSVMAGHCGDLKFQALKSAEQYDALAKQEEKLGTAK
ncbi:MAG TPA: hypothetical protein VJR29_11350 [bacterium]|nr:hypothetical protein [bacterium]